MSLGIITLNYEYFPEFNKGRPIFNGKIYIGEADQDPEILGNQLAVVARQEDGTDVAIAQPIRTSAGGIPTLNGNPVQLLVEGNYAIKVLDSNDSQVYYTENVFNGTPLVAGDDHNLLGNRNSVGAHDGIYPKQYTTFSLLLTAAFAGDLSEVVKVETTQHTAGGFGAATYVKDGTTGAASSGDEIQFFDNLGDGWSLVPQDGSIWVEQLGADPTGVADSTVACQNTLNAARNSAVANVAAFGVGTFKISGSLIMPSGDGIIIRGSGHRTVLDASAAASSFDLIGQPASVALGIVVEGFTLLGSPVQPNYSLNTNLCRNGSSFRDLSIGKSSGGPHGHNGIYLQAGFYINFNNIQIRKLENGIGFHAQSTDGTNTVNAVQVSNMYINGCGESAKLDAAPGFSSVAFTFSSCTFENSKFTSLIVENFQTVNLINCYFEGNNPTAGATEATMILNDGGTINVMGGFFAETGSANASAEPFRTINGGFISIDNNITVREENTIFYHSNLSSSTTIIRPIDFEASYLSMFKDSHTGGQGRKFVDAKNLEKYASQSSMPVSGGQTVTADTLVVDIDFDTTQTNEVWYFEAHLGDVVVSESRGGYRKFGLTVVKRAGVYILETIEVFDLNISASLHGNLQFILAAKVLSITLLPFNNLSSSMRWHISPIVCGRNDRFTIEGP